MKPLKAIDNFIITTAEKIIDILDSDGFTAFIVTLALIGITVQLLKILMKQGDISMTNLIYSVVSMMSEFDNSSFKRHRKSYLANKRKGR